MAGSKTGAPITFVVPGVQQALRGARRSSAAAPLDAMAGARVKAAVHVSTRRAAGAADAVRVVAVPGEDVVVLHLAGGPPLVLHPENARDLMLAQGTATRGATPAAAEVAVPAQLRWRALETAAPARTRGFLGDVLLSAFEVLTGLAKDAAVDLATSAVLRRVDGQVDAGVYALDAAELKPLKAHGRKVAAVPASTEPILVLIHGTFVDTASTFGKLWSQHPLLVARLFEAYPGRVYALDHPTLGESPIANALTLVRALPADARLHLATHSRGGLVAEVLARVAGGAPTAADFAFFAERDHAGQRDELQALAAVVADKRIRVDRVVRVACPAHGTLLASRRLDAYLSVLKWSLDLAGVPALPAMVDFLAEVARRRADPAEVPGLAAMMPATPLVEWLNATSDPIAGDLRVVAGDLEGDGVASWLKTLLADAYYWTDNDIVVQTRSMYGGAPRQAGASFLLDRGGRVTHFNYFANERTAGAVVDALTDALPATFRPIGPLSDAGLDAGGLRGAATAAGDADAAAAHPERPALFVLPGILGSNLAVDGRRVWLALRLFGNLERLRWRPDDDRVTPDGPVGAVYANLVEHLRGTHAVVPFGYDWRRPLEEEARRLADEIDRQLDARDASGQPVRLLAHSMGGLLARTVQLERPATWDRLMGRAGGRLVMLGTPNDGSWSPMQVLSGDDTFGNTLSTFGSPLRDRAARQLMAELPGFLQLQAALTDPRLALDRAETWAAIAERDLALVRDANWWHHSAGEPMQEAYRWGRPPQPVLDIASALRRRLDRQLTDELPRHADRMLLVVGHARYTPDGYAWTDQGLVYLDAIDHGDGRVPHASALLPGVRTWFVDAAHGALPAAVAAWPGYVELLVDGSTERLAPLAPAAATRGGASAATTQPLHVPSRPSRGRLPAAPAADAWSVFDADATSAEPAAAGDAALRVDVLNGNISFIAQPLLVGHYRSAVLTGAEAVVDGLVGGAMTAALDAGLYPDDIGTQQIFVNTHRHPDNPWRLPRPLSVIVVGLGDEGSLNENALRDSVRQAAVAWSQRVVEGVRPDGEPVELAATLMGSGGLGIGVAGTARAIVQGVHDANDRLAGTGWPPIDRITLVELYLDRASDAWRGLQVLATARPDRFRLAPTIASGTGPLRRQVDSGYRGADYDFITATRGEVPDSIAFSLDTRRAAAEMRSQMTQGKLLRDIVRRASTDVADDPGIGRTLFQLLVPVEVEPFLAGTQRMLLELDETTAPIPWELLETPDDESRRADPRPWSLRSRLLRRLRKPGLRTRPRDAQAGDAVYVVGEPQVDPARYGPLPGALAEARAVAAELTGPRGLPADRVTALLGDDDAGTVIGALLARPYRIVHVAGHGEAGADGGVVLSGGTFLGPREIRTMRTVPELVFVNCCHLAGRDAGLALAPPLDRSAFAAGVADALIEIGVRCVIAAGWAVEDGPAATFATTFYRRLLGGDAFIDAVGAAREAAWTDDPDGKTWAAYQCYGDPGWVFRAAGGDAQTVPQSSDDEYAGVASALALTLALEALVVETRWSGRPLARQLERARLLESRYAGLWGAMGAVAEAFGLAYAEAGDFAAAIGWYERAVQAGDGSASLSALEQLENLRARVAWEAVADRSDADDADAAAAAADAVAAARTRIRGAIDTLGGIVASRPSSERHGLLGSAWKRLALVERQAGDARALRAAVESALDAYRDGEALAADSARFYPALNTLALEVVLHAGDPGWSGLDPLRLTALRENLQSRTRSDPDFWSCVGEVELDLIEALAARRLDAALPAIARGYADIHGRLGSTKLWRSVADQAQLVLAPQLAAHAGAASTPDREAAERLLDQLQGYARGAATA